MGNWLCALTIWLPNQRWAHRAVYGAALWFHFLCSRALAGPCVLGKIPARRQSKSQEEGRKKEPDSRKRKRGPSPPVRYSFLLTMSSAPAAGLRAAFSVQGPSTRRQYRYLA